MERLEGKLGNLELSPEEQQRNQNLALLKLFERNNYFEDAAIVAKELGLTELARAYEKMAQQRNPVQPSGIIVLPSQYHSPIILIPENKYQ